MSCKISNNVGLKKRIAKYPLPTLAPDTKLSSIRYYAIIMTLCFEMCKFHFETIYLKKALRIFFGKKNICFTYKINTISNRIVYLTFTTLPYIQQAKSGCARS